MVEVFPQLGPRYEVVEVEAGRVLVATLTDDQHLRPGGTGSGPTLFALADMAFYAATLALVGRKALAVTTSTTINFMRKPPPGRLLAEARILKLGKQLAVGDVTIYADGSEDALAHASVTYSVPPP